MIRRISAPLALLTTLCAAGCVKPPEEPLNVGCNNWAGYAPLHLAESRSFYDKPVRVIEFSSNSDAMRAFRNGVIDVAALTLDEALLVKQHDPETRIFLVADVSDGADMILARGTIRSVTDLKGKRVGAEKTALGAFLLSRALQKARLRADDVVILPVDAADHEQAFLRGDVDALVTFAPVSTRLEARGAIRIFDSRDIPNEILDVLITRESTLAAKGPQLRALVAGWYRALAHLAANRDDALGVMAPRLAIAPADLAQIFTQIRFVDRQEGEGLLRQGHTSLAETAGMLSRIMLDSGLLYRKAETETLMPQPMQLQSLYR